MDAGVLKLYEFMFTFLGPCEQPAFWHTRAGTGTRERRLVRDAGKRVALTSLPWGLGNKAPREKLAHCLRRMAVYLLLLDFGAEDDVEKLQ